MSLLNIESVAADSNVLLSAIAGRAAKRILLVPSLLVVTTQHNIEEVREYLPEFAARYALDEESLVQAVELLPVRIVPEREYAHELDHARNVIAHRDEDDVSLAALALHLRIPIWSNDRDFENFPHGMYPTARLLALLGV